MSNLIYIKTDKNGTKYYMDKTCRRCGGAGALEQWRYTGLTCYKCGGSGIDPKPQIIKKYTPEYQAKLDERRAKRHEKERLKRIEEIRNNMEGIYTSHGFSPEGKLWAVIEPNSYNIKEELKEAGAKWSSWLTRWTFTEKPERWATVEILFEEVYKISEEWGSVNYNYDVDTKELIERKIPKPEVDSGSYVGEVGKRLELTVTFKGTKSWKIPDRFSYRGGEITQVMYIFEDAQGNTLIWKTTGYGLDYEEYPEGCTLTLRGTVKEHKEYKGIKQTVLQRVTVKGKVA